MENRFKELITLILGVTLLLNFWALVSTGGKVVDEVRYSQNYFDSIVTDIGTFDPTYDRFSEVRLVTDWEYHTLEEKVVVKDTVPLRGKTIQNMKTQEIESVVSDITVVEEKTKPSSGPLAGMFLLGVGLTIFGPVYYGWWAPRKAREREEVEKLRKEVEELREGGD